MTRRSLVPFNFRQDLEPLNWLRREVDELFNDAWKMPTTESRLGNFPLRVSMDVSESDNEVTITAELPGLEEKDINVELNNGVLTISGEKKIDHEEEGKNFHRIERSSGFFSRSLTIPTNVNEDSIQAKFKNGVLTISLPKSQEEKEKTKKIEVQSG